MRKQVVSTKAQLSRVHWDLILKTAVLLYVLTLLLGLALTALLLMVLNGGHLDAQHASQVASLLVAVLVIGVTGAGAFRMARTVDHAASLHGFLLGLTVALISGFLDVLFSQEIHLVGLMLYALMTLAGWLGGVLGARRRRPWASPKS